MKQQSFLLIPTADELTWKFDRPVLFLGEWCRRFNRRNIWENMDAVVAAPYGCGKTQKDIDRNQAKYLETKYFPFLCRELNRFHEVNYSERFWKILLGSWFERYCTLILNRVRTIEICLVTYNIDSVVQYSQEGYLLATEDSQSSMVASSDDIWNHYLALQILELLPTHKISRIIVPSKTPKSFRDKQEEKTLSLKHRLKASFYNQIRNIALRFTRDSDAMIIGSYLSLKTEILLQMALGQFPKWLIAQKLGLQVPPNIEVRRELTDQMRKETDDPLENIFQELLFQLLPTCYLEGFDHLNRRANEQPWPSKPKFIFTSNNFEYDEIFKLYSARKMLDGVPLIFGQHGNNYGTHRYLFELVEETVCDKFITWGWTGNLKQHTPAFLFRNAGKKIKQHNPQGGLLLVETHQERRYQTWDTSIEFLKYFENQVEFVGDLNLEPQGMLTVRLPLGAEKLFGYEIEKWKDVDPSIGVESGMLAMDELITNSRIIVHSYDSTGLLETLSRNIPTLAFWPNNLDHLRDSVLVDYRHLVDAGIVYLTPESAAKKVNEIWNNVGDWWLSEEVQNARAQFCMKYARESEHPIKDLKKILLENSVKVI